MPELAIEVRALRSPVLVGESLFVNTMFVNRGSEPVEIPSDSGPTPFRYLLHPLSGGQADFDMSWQRQREIRTEGTPPQPLRLPPKMLPPNYRSGRTDDLTDLASHSFPPGKYELRASVFAGGELLESPPAPIEIVPPKPETMVTAFCRESSQRISAFAQNTADGWAILQEQASMRRPEWSVWQRYTFNPGPKGPVTLAVAVDEGLYVGDRWLGWMEGPVVHAARFLPQSDVMPKPVQHAVDSGLTQGKLLSPGFQRPDGSAWFFAFGDGKLAAFRFADTGASRLWEVESTADLSAAAISLAPGASITAVYTEGRRLRYRRWALDGKPMTDATELFSLAEPVVNLHLEEVAAEPKLEIVVGPNPDPKYTVVRWVLNGAPKQTVAFVAGFPSLPGSVRAAAWGDRIELVAGFAGGYARLSLPGDNRWSPHRPGMDMISLDRSLDGRIWLHAFQPGFGFRWISLDGAPAH